MKKIKVGVVYGGISNERAISVLSGKEVIKGLSRKKYNVFPIEITKKGAWVLNKKKLIVFDKENGPARSDIKKFDVIFIALHGTFGEDGKVQAILDTIGVSYTGSGVLASALGFNKVKTLELARSASIKTPRYTQLRKNSKNKSQAVKYAGGYPLVVKPNRSGSSVGVSIIKNKREFASALKRAFKEDSEVIAEEYIKGRELTCGVLGNSGKTKLIALPSVEIITKEKFFDYHAKYFSKDTKEICPARVSKTIEQRVRNASVKIHEVLGCDGLTRSDFIVKGGRPYLLEITPLPGLTQASLCPKEARAVGMTFSEFLDKQITLALAK